MIKYMVADIGCAECGDKTEAISTLYPQLHDSVDAAVNWVETQESFWWIARDKEMYENDQWRDHEGGGKYWRHGSGEVRIFPVDLTTLGVHEGSCLDQV